MSCKDCGDYNGCRGCNGHDYIATRLKGAVSDTPQRGGTWETREKSITQIGGLDFGCNFDGHGKCTGAKACDSMWHESERGCCNDCAFYVGYLNRIPPEAVTPLMELFDPVLGYWTPSGCSIPLKWRSYTCLAYACKACGDIGVEAHDLVRALIHNEPVRELCNV